MNSDRAIGMQEARGLCGGTGSHEAEAGATLDAVKSSRSNPARLSPCEAPSPGRRGSASC